MSYGFLGKGWSRSRVWLPQTFPEICVEVKSPHNTWKKLYEKAQLYFEQSAPEVWFCNEQGAMTFTNLDGPIQHSELAQTFPQQLEL